MGAKTLAGHLSSHWLAISSRPIISPWGYGTNPYIVFLAHSRKALMIGKPFCRRALTMQTAHTFYVRGGLQLRSRSLFFVWTPKSTHKRIWKSHEWLTDCIPRQLLNFITRKVGNHLPLAREISSAHRFPVSKVLTKNPHDHKIQ